MTTETPEERIARLAARSAARRQATADPSSLPTYGTPENPKAANAAKAPAPKPAGRRHAARGSRTAALALSAGTTLSLATYFQMASGHENSTQAVSATAATTTPAASTAVDTTTATTATTATATATTATTAAATTAAATKSTTATSATTATTATAATTAATAATASTAKTATAATSSTLKDGTYTGGTYTNRWGPVQVQITVAGGRITAVTALQVPNSNSKDVAINNRAVPILVQSTLTAQSANISSVSGATYTSDSYKLSVQSAIDAARAAAAK